MYERMAYLYRMRREEMQGADYGRDGVICLEPGFVVL